MILKFASWEKKPKKDNNNTLQLKALPLTENDGIKLLVKNNIQTGITFVCHKKNIHELESVISLASELGVKGIKFSPLMEWGRAKEFLTNYLFSFNERTKLIKHLLSISQKHGTRLMGVLL